MHTPERAVVCGLGLVALLAPSTMPAQSSDAADSLVQRALASSPRIRSAASVRDASLARVAPAGAWLDPMLMAGIQNVPISRARAV